LDTSKLVFLNSTEHTAEAELGSLWVHMVVVYNNNKLITDLHF
jgi:hypothetical protein